MLLFSSVQFSRWVVPDSLQCHESQHARPPCPSPTLGVIVTRLDFSVLPPSKPSTQLQAFLQSLYHSLFILPLSPTFRFSLPKFLPPRHLFSVKHCLFSAVTLANSCPRLGLLGASVPVFLTRDESKRLSLFLFVPITFPKITRQPLLFQCLPVQETQVQFLGSEDLWERKWPPTAVFLLGKLHGQRSLAGYSSWGHKRAGHDLATI